MSCESVLVEELRARGLRLTPQREMVLQALHELGGHASADEAFQRIGDVSASVEKSTVYRTLELLRELDLVMQVDLGDGVLRYELTQHGPHAHLLCQACGRVLTLEPTDLAALAEDLAERFGFDMEPHQVIRGVCQGCSQQSAVAGEPGAGSD